MILLCFFLLFPALVSQLQTVNAGSYYYRDHGTFMADFKSLASAYPSLISYETVGKTVDGNDILMFMIGNPAGGRVLFDGAIHGEETLGSELLLDYAKWLLTSNDPLASQILSRTCTLLIPGVNVDNFNYIRVNAHHVDLNRNFATNWQNAGSTDPTSWYYCGSSPLSEPESQTLLKVFKTYKPDFYVNLHSFGGAYYLGSTYGNATYYNMLVDKINSMSQSRAVSPYPFYWTGGAGFAITDAARLGITSFLLETTSSTTIPLAGIPTTILPKFIPIAAVLSQESESSGGTQFRDGFESGNFSAWTGTYVTPGETATVVGTLPYQGNYSAKFTSNGTGGFEAAYSYESVPTSLKLYAGGYFYVSQSGIADNDDHFYFIKFSSGTNGVAYAGWRRTGGVDRWDLVVRDAHGWAIVDSNSSLSLNKWYRLELYWVEGATNGHGELYVNGALACSIRDENTTAFGGIDQVRFGLPEIYSSGPTTVYADFCRILGAPPWDPNQDGKVSLQDVSIVTMKYGSNIGSPNWNPLADINADGRVDLIDVLMVEIRFGEQYA